MKLPVRFWIITLMILSLLLTTSVVFITEYYVNRDRLEQDALASNLANARKLSALTNDTFQSMQQTLKAQHENVINSWDNLSELNQLIENMASSNSNFNSLTIINADGTGRANYPELNLVGNRVDSDGVNTGIRLKEDFISDPYIGTNGKLMIIVSTALYKDGEYLGMLNGLVWLQESNFLSRLLDEEYGDTSTFAAVYDQNGRYIYHKNTEWIGTAAKSNQATEDLRNNISGSSLIADRTDTEFYAGYANVPVSNWSIISMTPVEDILAPAVQSTIRSIWTTLPFILLSLLSTVALIWFVTKPLNQLSRLDATKPLNELLRDIQTIPSYYREVENVKTMIHAFGMNQQVLVGELEALAITDPLTGLANRRRFQHLTELIKSNEEPFGFLVMDIDHFKQVNDTYGHLMGDQVLIDLSRVIQSVIPSNSLAFRLGGEEFGVVVQNSTPEGVFSLGETIRHAVERHEFTIPQQVTVSIGAGYLNCLACDLNTFYHEVDQQLYKAKEGGRNRTETVWIEKGEKHLS